MRWSKLTLAAALGGLASAAQLTVSIASSQLLPNPAVLPSSTHAVLLGQSGDRHDVPIRRDNAFLFPSLAAGDYLLTIHGRDHFFPPLRIDVSAGADGLSEKVEAWQTFRGNDWDNKGQQYGSSDSGTLNIDVRAIGVKDYYQPRGGFNVLGFLKSPMILMGLFSMVMVFGLPYLMENMDPETRKEFEEMQSKSPISGNQGAATAMQNFDLASWMAGKASGADASDTGDAER
ncbi:hypothetical protein K431DRAFT_287570 [Polychaeton citri CBS 116435]|uniref:ER membrane protein complex subunit 7 beta-sandwich domain-containing protein n=1 Tax=Polychaeton citri CBS 116435 TaxID=1314669 RepID=A0A9P4Q500_9PEZI|nr:hypothetical protein K431DRAFT_287570 [Polychaeton citri CBS 116435]